MAMKMGIITHRPGIALLRNPTGQIYNGCGKVGAEMTGSFVQAFEYAHREGGHFRRPHTCSARSMPIFMVPADDGQVPHAPCTTVTTLGVFTVE